MVVYRTPLTADAPACGRILFEAFRQISESHAFPAPFPTPERATSLIASLINDPTIFGIVAEQDGRIIGSNFMSEGDPIRGIGPITIDPAAQGQGVGRALMQAALDRARGVAGIRLLQDSFNTRSLSLYASLGFQVKEPIVAIQGRPNSPAPPGFLTRPMQPPDIDACNNLCRHVHGYPRASELQQSTRPSDPWVAIRDGRLVAYATGPNFWASNHAVAVTTEDLEALLLGYAAARPGPLWFLLPVRQSDLFGWCLREGLRVTKPMTLMAIGDYPEIQGAWLPSVLY